jgi:GNAT superfamily N-acetyltransferase
MDIAIRIMKFEDIKNLTEEFGIKQGWEEKTIELYTKYFNEQNLSQRYVLVAEVDNSIAGYLTLLANDAHGPFANKNIPTVNDFNVLIKLWRRGIGTALMEAAENLAKKTSDEICLAVGLYTSYGAAQRMYVKRGYVPDGSGVWYKNRNLSPYESCVNDDELLLYMSKKI